MKPLGIVIPAAGRSSRMRGEDKLLRLIEGEPLLARVVRAAQAVSPEVVVVLPPGSPRRAAVGVKVAYCDSEMGMGASIACGVAALPEVDRVMILPADMPDLTIDRLRAVAAHRGLVRGADGVRSGHPVIFPCAYRPKLESLSGDAGAKSVLKGQVPRLVDIGPAACVDLDTPEAWLAWENGHR